MFLDNEYISQTKLFHMVSAVLVDNSEDKFAELISLFNNLNGNFALIIESQDEIICAVDRIRSIPLFYSHQEDHLIISDDAYYIKEQIKPELDEKNAAEFLVTGYVTGQDTLFEGIKQLQTGEILVYDKVKCFLTTSSYFRFLHKDCWDLDEDALLDKLDDCFVNVFNRLIESTVKQGLKIVVPLSGGLDSRIIVAMLKRLGVEDVICFTYGRKSDREVKISKEVADALGYEWHFVEYTSKNWYEYYHSNDLENYQKYGGNLSSLPHKQDILAIKILKDRGILSDNVVFIPGHSGDMLAGSHIPITHKDESLNYGIGEVVTLLLKKHYSFFKWDTKSELKPLFEMKIRKSIKDIKVFNNESSANAIELFDFNERQAKYIVNSVRAYEFFGFGWRLPLWDIELINFFLKTPLEYRIGQRLYIKYAIQHLSSCKTNNLNDIDCTTETDKSQRKSILNVYFHYFGLRLQSFTNPGWGRHFKNPFLSVLKLKLSGLNDDLFKQHPRMRKILICNNAAITNRMKINLISLNTYDYIMYILKEEL